MEYKESVTVVSGVSIFVGIVGKGWMSLLVPKVDGPMGSDEELSVDIMNQISIYELDVLWYGGGGIS
jgi:hypothetical protein